MLTASFLNMLALPYAYENNFSDEFENFQLFLNYDFDIMTITDSNYLSSKIDTNYFMLTEELNEDKIEYVAMYVAQFCSMELVEETYEDIF
jgi:hypothetical protein